MAGRAGGHVFGRSFQNGSVLAAIGWQACRESRACPRHGGYPFPPRPALIHRRASCGQYRRTRWDWREGCLFGTWIEQGNLNDVWRFNDFDIRRRQAVKIIDDPVNLPVDSSILALIVSPVFI